MGDSDIVKDFLAESYENLDRLDRELVGLEKDPGNREALASVFRTIHTIKGTCGFLGFEKLEKVAHVGENLLSKLRDGLVKLNPEITTALLSMVDAVRQMLSEIQATEQDGKEEYKELQNTLSRLLTGEATAPVAPAAHAAPSPQIPLVAPSSQVPALEKTGAAEAAGNKEQKPGQAPITSRLGGKLVERGVISAGDLAFALRLQQRGDKRRIGEILVSLALTNEKEIEEAAKPDAIATPRPASPPTAPAAAKPLRPDYKPIHSKIGGKLVERGILSEEDLSFALRMQERGDKRKIGEILISLALAKPHDVAAAAQSSLSNAPAAPPVAQPAAQPSRPIQQAPEPPHHASRSAEPMPEPSAAAAAPPEASRAAPPPETRPRDGGAETIRVGVNLLDKLMTLVGELVLARNQLLQFSNTVQNAGIHAVSQRMNLITSELQEEVMKTRMQPIGNIWSQFPRTVRDVAISCKKEVRIEMEGKETELDKTIIEAIKDPLTHLVRNSVDHGIELPAVREKSGKHPEGVLKLRAYHEGGHVNIEIIDDGAGINRDRVKQKAVERGLLTKEQAAQLSDREIFNLILLPGFSTAEKVTNVSGRGVGMDVVKTNVEKIGGTVDISSVAGKGTTVRVKIPLTLAIVPALIVACGGDRYAIPQVSLLELVRLEDSQAVTGIELVHGVPVYRLRGRLLPLVYLRRELTIPKTAGKQRGQDDAVNIVVLQADGRQFGLIVDEISDTEEIVVKPLSKQLKSIKTFAGASIMGDGKVALILDVLGLAQRANVLNETRVAGKTREEEESAAEDLDEKRTYLLFTGPDDSRMAMPLDTLARLEELPSSQVEKSGIQSVAQYRGKILPLVNLEYALEERRTARRHPPLVAEGRENKPLQVLVCNHEGNPVGLVVQRILDIVESTAKVQHPSSRAGVLCSAVIQGQVTELIDIPMVLRAARIETLDHEHAEVSH